MGSGHTIPIQDAARRIAAGEPEGAIPILEATVARTPAYAAAHVLLAQAYGALDRPDDALDAWHAAFFLIPTSPLVIRERRRLLMARVDEQKELDFDSLLLEALPTAETPPSEPEIISPAAPEGRLQEAPREAVDLDWRIVDEEESQQSDKSDTEAELVPPNPHPRRRTTDDELDDLIQRLQDAPRIRPEPHHTPDPDEPGEGHTPGLVSETMARILEEQGRIEDAAVIYAALADKHPDRSEEFERRAGELRERSR
jgi:tetratricopeptide (TPR) repeat protein